MSTAPRQSAATRVTGARVPDEPTARPALVEIVDATVVLGGRTVWSGVGATIAPGEFVAILGPNGVGKSTLLKAVLGLVPLARGTVRLLGRPPGQANHDVGYLPQRRSFDASLRIRGLDVVRLGLDGDRWGLPLPGPRSRAAAAPRRELVDLVGAGGCAPPPIRPLSRGEAQRARLAPAPPPPPPLLL